MDRRVLHTQADRIEMVLANHRAPARVTGGRVTPRTVQFHFMLAPTTKVAQIEKLSEEIALSLGVTSARLTRSRGQLALEVPRLDAQPVHLLKLQERLAHEANLTRALGLPGTAVLGMDSDGVPLLVKLASPDVAHLLIVGTTGSGKTELAKAIIASLMLNQKPRDVQIILIDPKGSAFKNLLGLPHLTTAPLMQAAQITERFRWLVGEMERREVEGYVRPHLVVVVDELADVLMTGGKDLQTDLTRLIQRGRSAGLSLIACTQKPTAAAVGSLVKANFPVRLVGRVTSADEARLASGMAMSGAERLNGHGDFILIAGGQQLRFQAAYIPNTDWTTVRTQITEGTALPRVERIEPRGFMERLRRIK
ncbi:MAG TPA: DNA translocase FtsK [Anaerolineae bacterium]